MAEVAGVEEGSQRVVQRKFNWLGEGVIGQEGAVRPFLLGHHLRQAHAEACVNGARLAFLAEQVHLGNGIQRS